MAGKLVDKQLQIIAEAQEKAANFLKKKVTKKTFSIEVKSLQVHGFKGIQAI